MKQLKKILYIEIDEFKYFSIPLSSSYNTTKTSCYKKAISILEKKDFNLVIINLDIVFANNLVWIKAINESKPNIPIVAIFSHLNDENKNKLNHLGVFKLYDKTSQLDLFSTVISDGLFENSILVNSLPKKNKCILIVNNNKAINTLLYEILRLQGYDVELASDGIIGLVKLEYNQINVISTSILMPNMGGKEFLERVIKWKPKIPVIVTSTFLDKEGALPLFRLGAFDFFSFPLDLGKYFDAINLAVLENERRKLS